MTKKQKKSIDLSMGGIMPRRLKTTKTIKMPNLTKSQQIRKLPVSKQKKTSGRSFGFAPSLAFIRSNVLYILTPLWILGLYLFAINDFPPAIAGDSTHALDFQHLSQINSIDFLPVKLFLAALAKLGINSQLSLRLLSVAIVFLSVFCFYKIVASWINKRAALLSVLLYSSTGWMLFQARQDTVSTMMFALMPVLLYFGIMAAETESLTLRILCGIVLAQLLFVPGGIWFMILAIIIGAVYEGRNFDIPSFAPAVISFIVTLAAYTGVIIGMLAVGYKTELLRLMGFFSGHLPALSTVKDNLLHLPSQLFYNGLADNSIWLHGTPVIDYVSLIFLITGLVYIIKNREDYSISRTVIGLFIILSLILIAINGPLSISIMVPVLYIAIAVGLSYIIEQWLVIFPSNPLARLFGIAVICASVFLVVGYQAERYFIGWPKTDEYHQIYKS